MHIRGDSFHMFGIDRKVFFVAICLASLTAPTSAYAQDSYRLTLVSSGTTQSLDVGNFPGVAETVGMMLPSAQPGGQFWKLQAQGGGVFKMTNRFNGPGTCLDVAGDGATFMAPCGPQIGQRWRIEEVIGQGVVLRNDYKRGQCLGTTYAGGRQVAAMQTCSRSFIPPSQIWVVSLTGR